MISECKFTRSAVKRMFEHFGSHVLYLNCIQKGNILLDDSLNEGEYRRLSSKEVLNITDTLFEDINIG